MKKIAFFLRIFDNDKFMNDFLDGKIYMNRLSYFRQIEDDVDNNRADPKEGVSGWWQPAQIVFEVNGRQLTDFAAPIEVRENSNDHIHLFCLFAAATDAENLTDLSKITQIQSDFSVPKECANLGEYYVVIHNAQQFINRMVKAVESQNYKGKAGLVEYYDPKDFSGDFGVRAVFNKPHQFSHQKEYRFSVDTNTVGQDALILDIGDIRDISTVANSWDVKVDIKLNSTGKIV